MPQSATYSQGRLNSTLHVDYSPIGSPAPGYFPYYANKSDVQRNGIAHAPSGDLPVNSDIKQAKATTTTEANPAMPTTTTADIEENTPKSGKGFCKSCGDFFAAIGEVWLGCQKQQIKLAKAATEFAVNLATKQEVRERTWNTLCNIGEGVWGFAKSTGELALIAGKYAVKLLEDPKTREEAMNALKFGASKVWELMKNPETWEKVGQFLLDLSKEMGLADIALGLKEMLLNPVYYVQAIGKLMQGDFKGAMELALKPMKGLLQALNGVKTLLLDFTGLSDMWRALVAFSKGDYATASAYFLAGVAGLLQTAAVVATVLTGGAACETIAMSFGLRTMLRKGAMQGLKIVGKDIGKELAGKLTNEAVEVCGKKLAREIGEDLIKRPAIKIAKREFATILSRKSARVFERELAELGSKVTLEQFVHHIMTRETTDLAVKKLQVELLALGQNKAFNLLRKATCEAADKIAPKQIKERALRHLVQLADEQGFTVNSVSDLVLKRISKYKGTKIEKIMEELRILAPEKTEKELRKMAKGLKSFAKGKLGKGFDKKMCDELSDTIYQSMMEDFEERSLKQTFSSQLDDLTARYGIKQNTVDEWKKAADEAFDEFCEKHLKKIIKEGVRDAISKLRARGARRAFLAERTEGKKANALESFDLSGPSSQTPTGLNLGVTTGESSEIPFSRQMRKTRPESLDSSAFKGKDDGSNGRFSFLVSKTSYYGDDPFDFNSKVLVTSHNESMPISMIGNADNMNGLKSTNTVDILEASDNGDLIATERLRRKAGYKADTLIDQAPETAQTGSKHLPQVVLALQDTSKKAPGSVSLAT